MIKKRKWIYDAYSHSSSCCEIIMILLKQRLKINTYIVWDTYKNIFDIILGMKLILRILIFTLEVKENTF
jgi:hypothetical protein